MAGFDGAVDTAWGWSELRVARSRRRPFSCGGCRELSVVGRMRGTGLELGWPGRDARPCAGIPGPYCIRIRFAWVHDHYVVFRLFCSRISHDPRSPYLSQYILNPGRPGDRPSRGLHPSSSSSCGHGQVSSPSDRPEEKTTEGSAGGNVVADGGRSTRNSLQQEKIGSHVDSCQLKLSTCHMLPQIQ